MVIIHKRNRLTNSMIKFHERKKKTTLRMKTIKEIWLGSVMVIISRNFRPRHLET